MEHLTEQIIVLYLRSMGNRFLKKLQQDYLELISECHIDISDCYLKI